MSIDAVALLRIPGFEPPEDADVRDLEDGFLLFLAVPYDSSPEALMDAVDDVVGEALFGHEEARGVFLFPDTAEPEDATTYDAVLEAVGDAGGFLSLGAEPMGDPQAMLGQMLEALGAGGLAEALQSGDPDAMKLAQIQMMSAMERALGAAPEGGEIVDAEFEGGDVPPGSDSKP